MGLISVLVFSNHYLPAYKAGGAFRIVAGIVEGLGDELEFKVVTLDRDLGDARPYPGIKTRTWLPVGKARVMYLSPRELSSPVKLRSLIRDTDYDVAYFSSFLYPDLTIKPLLLRRLGLIPKKPVILTPAGEFSPGALAIKRPKKVAYILLAKALGLYRGVVWHAASEHEEADIRRVFGGHVSVECGPYLPAGHETGGLLRVEKLPGRLRAVFLSRINPKKNLEGALRMLQGLEGEVLLDVYGPPEDARYTAECRRVADTLPPNVEVRFLGPVLHDEVARIMAEHDVFLFPTHGESFGYVILEALLAGTPVLISDQTPWRHLGDTGVGWDLSLDDDAAFREVLQHLVWMDDVEHRRWSERARVFGVERARDSSAVEQNRKMFLLALQRGLSTAPTSSQYNSRPL